LCSQIAELQAQLEAAETRCARTEERLSVSERQTAVLTARNNQLSSSVDLLQAQIVKEHDEVCACACTFLLARVALPNRSRSILGSDSSKRVPRASNLSTQPTSSSALAVMLHSSLGRSKSSSPVCAWSESSCSKR
jgi:hypothetical protein